MDEHSINLGDDTNFFAQFECAPLSSIIRRGVFNERLLALLRRDLAERQADFDADRHDLELRRYHAARAFLVQVQIEDMTRRQEELEPPMPATPCIVDASSPQKTRTRSRRRQRVFA